MKTFLKALLVFLAGVGAGVLVELLVRPAQPPLPPVPQVDTIRFRDTITIEKPVPVIRRIRDSIYVPVIDTLHLHDTLFIALPREEVVYEDSTYRAVVSGYRPSLDTISVYPLTTIVTKIVKEKAQPKVSIGVQGGIGVMYQQGFHAGPYIGFGVQYNLLNF